MLGIYFSGTGNSRYALEVFLGKYDETAKVLSVEDENIVSYIKDNEEIVFSYSVQYSNIPKMLKDFIDRNQHLWTDKKIFVIATMGLFSGDGASILARRLHKYGAQITGGLHLKMPDSIADVKALKRPVLKNKELVREAEEKIDRAAQSMKNGKPLQEGIGLLYHMAGLFGQRLYFYQKTKRYTDKLKIDAQKCVGCGRCAKECPMNNLDIEHNLAKAGDMCTMCYRCINICPKQAITLLGKEVVEQGTGECIYHTGEQYCIMPDTPHAVEPVNDTTYSMISVCISVDKVMDESENEVTRIKRLKQIILDVPENPFMIEDMAQRSPETA